MKPYKAGIRSYQVGFGDCFLLSFHYRMAGGKEEARHVLIDCGSTAPPVDFAKARKSFSLLPVAMDIKNACGGKLHAVVATHRHKDHISGFATAKNKKGPGDVLAALKPDLVLQPWTEDPRLPVDAKRPRSVRRASGRYALGLQGMHAFSAGLLAELRTLSPAISENLRGQLSFLGEDNLLNLSAVKNLMSMGKPEYLCYGMKTGLEKLLPGVRVKVLGPPTLEQCAGISKQRSEDAAEFWMLHGAAPKPAGAGAPVSPFASDYRVDPALYPPDVRWIIPRVRACRGAQLRELVRILDDQMNNTSLILLFRFGNRTLLFPGDGQIESWEYALRDAPDARSNRRLLAATDLYKVGHHGSRNATPKSLWTLFAKKGTSDASIQTLLSTRAGKHGDPATHTEVPRKTLKEELRKRSRLHDTEDLRGTGIAPIVAVVQ